MNKKINNHNFIVAITLCLMSGTASGAIYNETAPNSPITPSFIEAAFNVDPYFSSYFNADIGDIAGNNISERSSHVTINGTGDGSYDYYSFTVYNDNTTGVFDIDYGSVTDDAGRIDTEIALWSEKGSVLKSNDDYMISAGAGGSSSQLDSFIQYNFSQAGNYVIGVAKYNSSARSDGWSGITLDPFSTYTLNIALGTGFAATPSAVPVPPALYLFLSGLVSAAGLKRAAKNRS